MVLPSQSRLSDFILFLNLTFYLLFFATIRPLCFCADLLNTWTVHVGKDLSNKTNRETPSLKLGHHRILIFRPSSTLRQKVVHPSWQRTQARSHSCLSDKRWDILKNSGLTEGWAGTQHYLYPVRCCKLLCCNRSSLRADRLAERSTGRDVNRFQLRSSFSRKDKEKKACGNNNEKSKLLSLLARFDSCIFVFFSFVKL